MDGSHPIGRLLIDSEDVILSIATFLSAKDCFNLHAVNRGWHDVISKHDETLFKNHLRYDFDEGEVLDYVAENQNLSYKKLYRAFRGRWSLPKQADPNIRAASNRYDGDRNTRILIPWAKPPEENPREQYQGAKLLVPNDDIDNVVFIARLGGDDGDNHSALMDWNPESNPKGRLIAQQLIIDQSWSDDRGNLVLPKVDYIYGEYNPLTLTLHAIDTKYYQVASLLEDSPMDIDGYLRDREEHSKLKLYYGYDGPTLYGVPFKGSPFCRELKHDDFEYFRGGWEWGRDREYPPLDYVSTGGALVLDEVESERLVDDNYDDEEDYE